MTIGPSHEAVRPPQPPVHADAFDRELLQKLDALCSLDRSNPDLLTVSVDAPSCDALNLWQLAHEFAWHWSPPGRGSRSGLGIACDLRASGPDRFAAIRREAASLWLRMARVGSPPDLVGGFSFTTSVAPQAYWSAFGDARFVLPRWFYANDSGRGTLWLTIAPAEAQGPMRNSVERELGDIAAVLRGPLHATPAHTWNLVDDCEPPFEHWRQLVDEARHNIAGGSVRKVVGARSTTLRSDRTMNPEPVLRCLRRDHPACTAFAIRFGRTTFLGATPETLVRKRGSTVDTEALAGTCQHRSDPDALLASVKNRHEQHLVTEEIVRCLHPLCSSLRHARLPVTHRLRNLVHLRTPISGALRADTHVLEVVERLHPTPAVGGLPREEALEFIRMHEAIERGWYASPIGWFDSAGDGTFAVALRCGLMYEDRAILYAGAGLVAGSDPQGEYDETHWKMQPMRDALREGGSSNGRVV